MTHLLVVGASYRTADVSLLERMALAPGELASVLATVAGGPHVDEVVVLSTCNRVEIYAGVSSFHGGVTDLSAALAARAGVDPAVLAGHLYVHWDTDAVAHTLRVVTGLDSMVAGEAQILGQVRDAYTAANEAGATGRMLHDLMQQALRVGKRAHAETDIDAAGRSVVTAALDAAVAHGADAQRGAVVIGAGAMGALTMAALTRAGVGPRYVASRTRERAHRLAGSYDATAARLSELPDLLANVDLVVSATASAHPVLTAGQVEAGLARRPADRGPLVICDIAVPRDVDPAAGDLPGVTLIDITRLAAQLPASATTEVAAVEAIIAEEIGTVRANLRGNEIAPTVAALRARADEVVGAELARLHQRLPDLDDTARAEIRHAVHRLVQRLLHQPTVRVRQLAAEPGGQAYAAVLAELFDLQVPEPRRAGDVPDLRTGPGPEVVDEGGSAA